MLLNYGPHPSKKRGEGKGVKGNFNNLTFLESPFYPPFSKGEVNRLTQ